MSVIRCVHLLLLGSVASVGALWFEAKALGAEPIRSAHVAQVQDAVDDFIDAYLLFDDPDIRNVYGENWEAKRQESLNRFAERLASLYFSRDLISFRDRPTIQAQTDAVIGSLGRLQSAPVSQQAFEDAVAMIRDELQSEWSEFRFEEWYQEERSEAIQRAWIMSFAPSLSIHFIILPLFTTLPGLVKKIHLEIRFRLLSFKLWRKNKFAKAEMSPEIQRKCMRQLASIRNQLNPPKQSTRSLWRGFLKRAAFHVGSTIGSFPFFYYFWFEDNADGNPQADEYQNRLQQYFRNH